MKKRKWYKWPEGYINNNVFPWYQIIWRIVWAIPTLLSFGLTYMLVMIGYGVEQAESFRKAFW